MYEKVPHEMKVLPNWVGFKVWPDPDRPGKLKKEPYQVNGALAKSTDPKTWTSYPIVVSALERGEFDAIGFALTNSPFVGFDYDHCVDLVTGELLPSAQEVIDQLHTYTEKSISGTGIHLLMKGTLPEGGRRSSHVLEGTEMYDTSRFFVTTGEHVAGTPTTIENRTLELRHIHRELFPPEPAKAPSAPTNPNSLSDDDIIERASEKNKNFKALWAGDWEGAGYPSHSEADAALCSILAFWTGNDSARMDGLFRQSALNRKKWETTSYRNRTIQYAIEGTHTTYNACYGPSAGSTQVLSKEGTNAATDKGNPPEATARDFLDWLERNPPDSFERQAVKYAIEPEIPRGALVLITGKPGCGKSTLVLKWCQEMAAAGSEILYLDRDNPLSVVQERKDRFGGTKAFPRMKYWGLWMKDQHGLPLEPPVLSDRAGVEKLKGFVKGMKDPVVIFDTFASFSECDENQNSEVQKVFKVFRDLTTLGATVLVIHHTTKNEVSEYRGASAMAGAIDVGLKVVSSIKDARIQTLEVQTFKSRLGDGKPILYRMVNGAPQRVTASTTDFLMALVRQNPGLTKEKFEKVAIAKDYSRATVRKFMEHGIVGGTLTLCKERGLNIKGEEGSNRTPPSKHVKAVSMFDDQEEAAA